VHFWRLEEPNGPTALGVCKYCKSERRDSNSGPVFDSWHGQPKRITENGRPPVIRTGPKFLPNGKKS